MSGPCPTHPDWPSLGACARCGRFYCAEEVIRLGSRSYCGECGIRPEVDYVEAFRLKYWGKRDGWAWLFGIGGVIQLVGGLFLLAASLAHKLPAIPGLAVSTVVLLVAGGNGICFWLGRRFARKVALGIPLLGALVSAVTGDWPGLGANLFGLLITTAIYRDTRNRLFFRIEVPREKLVQTWNVTANNPMARNGFALSLLGLFVPFLGVLGGLLSYVGLRRFDPDGNPPQGRRRLAIAGIVIGMLTTAGWTVLVVMSLRDS